MVVVAVAGGTGGIGRAIVEALVAQGKHTVKVLSRKVDPVKEAELGVPFITADYNDVPELAAVLESNNVHTVISALNMMPHVAGPVEPNLIRAADASKATRRMISSDYGHEVPEEEEPKLPSLPQKRAAKTILEATKDLEWTRFQIGFLLDYYGLPKVKSYMTPITLVLDAAHDVAAIPGDGETKVTFTHSSDVGKFIAASLDLEKWDHTTYLVGDRVSWNEFVRLFEEAKGSKVKVVYDDVEKLKGGEATELPGQAAAQKYISKEQIQAVAARFGLWFAEGWVDLDESKSITNKFPEIRAMKVKDFLKRAWGN